MRTTHAHTNTHAQPGARTRAPSPPPTHTTYTHAHTREHQRTYTDIPVGEAVIKLVHGGLQRVCQVLGYGAEGADGGGRAAVLAGVEDGANHGLGGRTTKKPGQAQRQRRPRRPRDDDDDCIDDCNDDLPALCQSQHQHQRLCCMVLHCAVPVISPTPPHPTPLRMYARAQRTNRKGRLAEVRSAVLVDFLDDLLLDWRRQTCVARAPNQPTWAEVWGVALSGWLTSSMICLWRRQTYLCCARNQLTNQPTDVGRGASVGNSHDD